jgi:H+/Cl- antiporter ClcA
MFTWLPKRITMRKRITEETILFASVLKWFVLSTAIGIIVGLSTTFFLKALNWSWDHSSRYPYYFLLLPFAMFLSDLAIKYLAPDAEGHGTEKVIEAIHKTSGRIRWPVVPIKLLTTIITIATGGSVGKEGPCAQIGAGLSSIFSDIFKFDDHDRKKIVICGISAGFASVFGTPIAGAIFGVEVLFVGNILYEVLLPSFISGVTAYEISTSLGISYFYHPLNFVPRFSEAFFIKVAVAGVFFGLCSWLLIESLGYGKKQAERLKIWRPLKGLAGGAAIILLTLVFSRDYLGLGLDTIQEALQGQNIIWYAFFLKIIYTSITLNFGGSGGIVTPIFFVGATAGTLFARITGLDTGTFAAVGLVAVLAGAANTPIAASIRAVELFGPKIAPYATVACVISFLMTGHRSVYPSQILAMKKSHSIQVELGKEMEGLEPQFQRRSKSLLGIIFSFLDKIRGKKEEDEFMDKE